MNATLKFGAHVEHRAERKHGVMRYCMLFCPMNGDWAGLTGRDAYEPVVSYACLIKEGFLIIVRDK